MTAEHGTQKELLLALGKLDKKICMCREKKNEFEKRILVASDNLKKKQLELKKLDTDHKTASLKQSQEEERLRLEEQKITERRKQITAMGGAKSAKFAERDLDMATKVIQSMEEAALLLMEAVDKLSAEMSSVLDLCASLEVALNKEKESLEPQINKLAIDLSTAEEERKVILPKIEEVARKLYLRITTKYQADPLSIIKDPTCSACQRSLPSQVFNKVVNSDEILQCPGCSRILVAEIESELSEE